MRRATENAGERTTQSIDGNGLDLKSRGTTTGTTQFLTSIWRSLKLRPQLNGSDHDPRRPPRVARSHGIHTGTAGDGRFPDRKFFTPHIPSKLRKIVQKCIETNPADRFQSTIDVANALAGVDGKTLDWRLAEMDDKRVWIKNESGTHYEFTVSGDGASECYKTAPGGKPRRVGAGCKKLMSEKEIKKFLEEN